MSNKPESSLFDKTHTFKAVNRPTSLGIGPDQSQIRTCGHHWRCPTNLKADWTIDCSVPGPLTDQFPWGSGLTNHRSECVDIAGDVHQSYLPIGSQTKKVLVTTPNFLSPSGFDLNQSEHVISGHHWWCRKSCLLIGWNEARDLLAALNCRSPLGFDLGQTECIICGDVHLSYLPIDFDVNIRFVTTSDS
jgi:hypothetical protein